MTKTMRRGTLLVLVLGLGALAPAGPQPADPGRAVAQAQLKVIEQARKELDERIRAGVAAPSDDETAVLWARRKVEALRASGADKKAMIVALEGYQDAVKAQENLAQRRYEVGQATHNSVLEMQYRRLEAELWLIQEKAR